METDRYYTQKEVELAKFFHKLSKNKKFQEFNRERFNEILLYGYTSYTDKDLKRSTV